MKSVKTIIKSAALSLAAFAGMTSFTGCQDNFDIPPVGVPEATMTANTTIAELKEALWSDDNNYAVLVGKKADGQDYIVKGRVISSDAAGNIYKSLVIQDATGALPMSINMTSMYNTYRVGQEVVVDVTGLYCGKYAGYEQLGGYGEYNGTPQTSFMTQLDFTAHAELNLLPSPNMSVVDPASSSNGVYDVDGIYCLVADMGALPQTAAGQRLWQGQLVEFRNVYFQGGGSETYATESDWASGTTSRTLCDSKGNTITVRNSGYATFCKDVMPSGTGTVRGILSYFNGAYQLLIRSTADVIFDSKGNLDDPYSVAEAVELQGTGASGWVSGYIVGSVKAGVSTVVSSDQIIWSKDAEMDNTLVIGPTKDCKDIAKCLVVALPQGSAFRTYGNLLDNPAVYQASIKVFGTFDKYLGTPGLTGNNGTTGEFVIEGVTPQPNPDPTTEAKFTKATSITSTKGYALVATGYMAVPMAESYTYGYLKVENLTVNDNQFTTAKANAFTFVAVDGGYTISDCYGRYLYMTGTYNSFNLSATMPASGAVWTVEPQSDGSMKIMNVDMQKYIQKPNDYDSFGAYNYDNGTMPVLYEMEGNAVQPNGGGTGGGTGGQEGEYVVLSAADAYDFVGTYVAETPKSDSSNGQAAHWQPLESLKIGNYTFSFSTSGSTQPAWYDIMSTATSGDKTIRVYSGSTMTITAPAGSTLTDMVISGSNGASSLAPTASVGTMSYSNNTITWKGSASSVKFSFNGTYRVISVKVAK